MVVQSRAVQAISSALVCHQHFINLNAQHRNIIPKSCLITFTIIDDCSSAYNVACNLTGCVLYRMPHGLLSNLHHWRKNQIHEQQDPSIPTEPRKPYLLGFPGVKAEYPKTYIRELWLVAENDRVKNPKFLANNARELFQRTNKVISEFVKDEAKLCDELESGNFLQADAERILIHEGFGELVWGTQNNAPESLFNKHGKERPKWFVVDEVGLITPYHHKKGVSGLLMQGK